MKIRLAIAILTLLLSACVPAAFAQTTAFTYQGRLLDNGEPANGTYEFQFTLFGNLSGGSPVAGPVSPVPTPTPVTNGLFTVTLDFSSAPFMGANRWLEIDVRTNGSPDPFTTLAPRPQILPVPYAIYAHKAGTASVATVVGPNAVGPSGLQNDSVNSMKIADGTIMAGDLSSNLLNDTFWRLLGNANTLPGTHFLGTTDNRPLLFKVNGTRVMRFEDKGDGSDSGTIPDGAPNVIAGSSANTVGTNVVGATIAGGGATNQNDALGPDVVRNSVEGDFGTVGGGLGNRIQHNGLYATIAGGRFNNIGTSTGDNVIGGGLENTIAGNTIGATVAGGLFNSVGGASSYTTIAGGQGNALGTNALYGSIGGGLGNAIAGDSWAATVAGGRGNNIGANSSYTTIAGGIENLIGDNSPSSTIGGGSDNAIANGMGATIAGGDLNLVRDYSFYATIAGGRGNALGSNALYSSIGGGLANDIADYSSGATVAGGNFNRIRAMSHYATIGGGQLNTISNDSAYAVIGGGGSNTISTVSGYAVIGGGESNTISTVSDHAVIAGGEGNVIFSNGGHSAIGGGQSNMVTNQADWATIPGGRDNAVAGDYAFAAGRRAKANHAGTFAWADSQNADFASTSTDQFLVRASGGVGIGTTAPAGALDVNGDTIVRGLFTLASATVAPGANETLAPTRSYLRLNPAAFVTLNSTTAIADGSAIGNVLILQNIDSIFAVAINNGANTRLGANRTLGPGDSLTLLWDGANWVELSFAVNN